MFGFELHLAFPGALLFTPWYWFNLSVYAEGGFHIEITNPRSIKGWMGPEYVGEIYGRPHSMAIMGWLVPRSPRQWRWEILHWMGRL